MADGRALAEAFQGVVLDLDGVIEALMERDYDGWLMVEQDASLGSPSEAVAVGRRALAASLRRLGKGRVQRSVA